MNPNSLHPSGIHHHHPQPHHYSPLQPPPSLHHSHQTHLHQPHPPTHAHSHPHPHTLLPHPGHHPSSQQQLQGSSNARDPIDDQQVQQQSNIQNYKNSANAAFHGYIQTTHDALLIFQACSMGISHRVTRRLHERERRQIQSGTVYVFDEAEAGIKRWTDGRMWSPSRILNNFLVYREIDQKRQPAPSTGTGSNTSPGTVAAAENDSDTRNNPNNTNPNQCRTASASNSASVSAAGAVSALSINATAGPPPGSPVSTHPPQHTSSPQHHVNQNTSATSNAEINGIASSDPNPAGNPEGHSPSSVENQTVGGLQRPANREREQERALVGSLTTTYKFRANGLVKKTISVGGMHMISYYRMEDVISGRLRTPTTDPSLRHIAIAPRFLQPSLFRVPPTWGRDVNGALFIHDEGTDQSSPTISSGLTSTTNTSATFHNGPRSGAMGAPTNSVTGLLSSQQSSSRTNGRDGIPTAPISRPSSSAGSPGSPGAPSPVSPHAFPTIMSAANLGSGGGSAASAAVGTAGVRAPFGRLQPGSTGQAVGTGTNATGGGGARTAAGPATGSTRYEPYPRPNRSPPPPPSLTSGSSAMAEAQQPSYYGHSQSAAGNSSYSNHAFLSDSHPSSLVSSQPRQSADRNGTNDSTARDGRPYESIGQVSYGNSGSYKPTTTASGANESLYGPYPTSTSEVTNTQHRSASVPPGSFGLPPIDRLGGAGSQGSSSGPARGGGGEMQFSSSGSGGQPLGGRLPSTGAHGGGYAAYMSAVPAENGAFRGGGLVGRENQQYGSSLANNAPVSSSPSSGAAGVQTFLYPPPSSAPPSTTNFPPQYPFCASMHHHHQQTHEDQLGRRTSGGVSSAVAGGMVGSEGGGGGEAGRAAIRAAGLARISSGGGSGSGGGNRHGESGDTNTTWSNHQVGTSASSSSVATNTSTGATTITTTGGLSHVAMKTEENGC